MEKITLFRLCLVLVVMVLLVIVGNANASADFRINIPIIQKNSTLPKNTGHVTIPDIHSEGTGSSEPDEYVEIKNRDAFPIQLQNWTLRDDDNHLFTFPSFVIQPDQTCRVYTNEDHPEWCGFNYGSDYAIWGNSSDEAELRDADGNVVFVLNYVVIIVPIP